MRKQIISSRKISTNTGKELGEEYTNDRDLSETTKDGGRKPYVTQNKRICTERGRVGYSFEDK